MPPLATELYHAIRLFHESGIRFVVVGGVAMVLHGSAHVTTDVDFAYARDRNNLRRLAETLAGHHARLRGVPDDIPFVLDEQMFRNDVPKRRKPYAGNRYRGH